jgi:hypothetical protein
MGDDWFRGTEVRSIPLPADMLPLRRVCMVWLLEKKIIHHVLTLGFDTVDIPVRVRFGFEVRDGTFVPGSLSTHTLYNRDLIEQRYPAMDLSSLEATIGKTVEKEIRSHLNSCGFLDENNEDCNGPHSKQ